MSCQANRCIPRVTELFQSRQSFCNNAARHIKSFFNRRDQFVETIKPANCKNRSLRFDQGEIVNHHRSPWIKARQQQRIQKSRIRPEGTFDHSTEILDPPRFRSSQVSVLENSIPIQIEPRAAIPILRSKHVPIPAQLDRVICHQIAGKWRQERRGIAGVNEVLPSLHTNQAEGMHRRRGHICRTQLHFVSQTCK